LLLRRSVGRGRREEARRERGIAVTTDKAVTKTIVQTVTATGKVQPEVEVKITPEVYGEITSLPFREGAVVKKGDVIVKIKPDFYQAQVDQQTAAVAAARAGAVNSLVQLEKAEADLKKYQDLYDRKLVSDFDYVTYKTAFDAAKAEPRVGARPGRRGRGPPEAGQGLAVEDLDLRPDGRDGELALLGGRRARAVVDRVRRHRDHAGRRPEQDGGPGEGERERHRERQGRRPGQDQHRRLSRPQVQRRGPRDRAPRPTTTAAPGSGATAQASGSVSDEVTNFIVKIRVADKDVASCARA
jgi:HlyD family secretion protein